MTISVIKGDLFLNEQDPYEPTGLVVRQESGEEIDLADWVEQQLGLKRFPVDSKRVRIIIETI